MKKRLIITLAMCIIHLMGKYFAARSITFLTIMTIPPTSLVVGTFFLVGLFTVAVWDFCGVFKLWGKYKIKAVIPFALCLMSFFLDGSLSKFGLNHRIAAFQAELPAFEKKAEGVVEELRVRSTSGNQQDRSHHFGQYDGFNIYAEADTNGVPTVRFVRVITMNFHHRGYMYRPDGKFDVVFREREQMEAPINEKWCAIRD